MKKLSKLTSLLLAAALAAGLFGTAFAAEASRYTDVPAWAKEYVDRVTELGLVDGRTASTFGAGDPMTRAELVTALYRLAGSPNVKGAENPFADVAENAAYRDAVVWAYAQKIAGGKTQGVFEPGGSVKRQEIAKILNEFAARQVGKPSLTSREDEISACPDAGEVSAWAREYMNWAVASGFITGQTDGTLNPRGTATRAQVSAILCRYMDDASTGDASKDNPRNQDPAKKSELLVVSFGTSFNDNRAATIKAIEDDLAGAFAPRDMSISSVTAVFGAPVVLYLMASRRGRKGEGI